MFSVFQCVFLLALLATPARAQVLYQQLKSFGVQPGVTVEGPLVQDNNGVFYATTQSGGASDLGTVFRVNADGSGYTVLHSFAGGSDGASPAAGLALGTDGTLYGTTSRGGSANAGTVFKIGRDGSSYTVLQSFTGTNGDPALPMAPLIQGKDGSLYGTTSAGGAANFGTVFKLNTSGSGYSVLKSFTGTNGDGDSSYAALLQGSNNVLYGTTAFGGSNSGGTVFRLNPDGSGFTNIHDFSGSDGENPYAGLVQAPDGTFYGTTYFGGGNNLAGVTEGTVFKLNSDGSGFTVLMNFDGFSKDGGNPQSPLLVGVDGSLYGTVLVGGDLFGGAVFNIDTNGNYTIVYSFGDGVGDGENPESGLMWGADGLLYGTTTARAQFGNGTLFVFDTGAAAYTNLYAFSGAEGEGFQPGGTLLQGIDGALYGTTSFGGTMDEGTVFRLSADGISSITLHSFTGPAGDGLNPGGNLAQGPDGSLYGTTASGILRGPGGHTTTYFGSVFKLNPDGGNFRTLTNFTGLNGDGWDPAQGVVLGADGALYGATISGGSADKAAGGGTIYKIGTDGTGYHTLYRFSPRDPVADTNTDGFGPYAALLAASDGNLYGTALDGGSNGFGTMFKIGTDGSGFSPFHSFGAASDGAFPHGSLLEGPNGLLYGSTYQDNGGSGNGSVFQSRKDGSNYAVLGNFPPQSPGKGVNPLGALVEDSKGELLGVTLNGGDYTNSLTGFGTVFEIGTNGGAPTTLHSFSGAPLSDGALPMGGLVETRNGLFYGTTTYGGILDNGTVFLLALPPANNNFSNRTVLSGATLTADGNNYLATTESNEPDPSGNGTQSGTVWWSWIAPTNGPVSIQTDGSSFETLIDVYTGNTLAGLTCVASNLSTVLDNSTNDPADAGISNRVIFTATAGTQYQIQISGLEFSGRIHLQVNPVALQVLGVVQTNNPDGTISFGASVGVGNSGIAVPGALRIRVVAEPGVSRRTGIPFPLPLPAERPLGIYNLASPNTVAPGGTANVSISGICPASITLDPNAAGIGWGVFALLEEESGTNWYVLDKDLVFFDNPVWPVISGFLGTGGGVIRINPSAAIDAADPGYVRWQIGPPAAVRAGAAWRLQGDLNYSTSSNYIRSVVSTNPVVVEFKPIPGWNLPAGPAVETLAGTLNNYVAFYTVTNPVLKMMPGSGLALSGTTGTVYRIESRTSLTSGAWAPAVTNTITASGFNVVLPPPPAGQPTTYYRAVWLP